MLSTTHLKQQQQLLLPAPVRDPAQWSPSPVFLSGELCVRPLFVLSVDQGV